MTNHFTADLHDPENATWLAALPTLVGNGHRVDVDGSTIDVTQETLNVLAGLTAEDDGNFDGVAIWIEGTGYAVSPRGGKPLGVTIDQLADEVIADREIDRGPAVDVVRAIVDQISDDPQMWDAERGLIIGAGVHLVSESLLVEEDSTSEHLLLAELEELPSKEQLEERRDELVRKLMKTTVKRSRIAAAAGVQVGRLYQIRDGR